ncbi:hypothetical protein R5R35_006042 [Gryllus longicercus]|uniref:Protein FAM107B n=2 Tax=Gryllus longicercus TaxID=2509291 RepID=A0AAN9Z8P8_9ORTH
MSSPPGGCPPLRRSLMPDIRRRMLAFEPGDAESAGVDAAAAAAAAEDARSVFPDEMIPEPELCRGGAAGAADLDRRNRRNHHGPAPAAPPTAPPLPPPPPFSPEGLILPRKLHNPCLESNDHKNLHRELLFNQKVGKNVLNQKSELQKAFGKHKEQQVRKELEQQRQNSKSDFERMVEERARRMDLLEKERSEDSDKCSQGESEFLKVHAKMRARMDSK